MKKTKSFILSFIFLILCLFISSNSSCIFANTNVYRLYNPATGEHLYTPNHGEVEALVYNFGWNDEGTGWISPDTGDPVYRLYNPRSSDHLYSTSLEEINNLISYHGWIPDNHGYPLFNSSGNIPVYRLYNPRSGRHHLTTNAGEYALLPGNGWNQENLAFSAIGVGNSNPTTSKPVVTPAPSAPSSTSQAYVVNVRTNIFHYPSCSTVTRMSRNNRRDVNTVREDLIAQGYRPCKVCKP